jgi:alpha-glucosidase (family GH31 glycosyl hydrolase)
MCLVDAYKNQSEVIALAQKFKDKGLSGSVGVIVCDLPEPTESPYYRLDPKRFPDVKAMAVQVKELTGGATLMPNIKPTGVDSTDCPACGTQVCSTECPYPRSADAVAAGYNYSERTLKLCARSTHVEMASTVNLMAR